MIREYLALVLMVAMVAGCEAAPKVDDVTPVSTNTVVYAEGADNQFTADWDVVPGSSMKISLLKWDCAVRNKLSVATTVVHIFCLDDQGSVVAAWDMSTKVNPEQIMSLYGRFDVLTSDVSKIRRVVVRLTN